MANEQVKKGQGSPIPGAVAGNGNKPAAPAATEADNKTPDERFRELAPKRTRSVLKQLEILGNCSNRSGYSYSQEQVDKIFDAIIKKAHETKAKFQPGGAKKGIDFQL